jgi:hypothetical protein
MFFCERDPSWSMKLRNRARPTSGTSHRSLMRHPFHVLFRLDCSRKCWQEVCHETSAQETGREVNASGTRTCSAVRIALSHQWTECPVAAGNRAAQRQAPSVIASVIAFVKQRLPLIVVLRNSLCSANIRQSCGFQA